MAILRERLGNGISVLSATTAAGGGLGFAASGLVSALGGYRAAFWVAAGIALLATVAVGFIVAGRSPPPRAGWTGWESSP
jgi:predicted MFS family arabinose efflux permease